jgi:hypothetical protein
MAASAREIKELQAADCTGSFQRGGVPFCYPHMMRLNNDVYVLELPVVLGGQSFPVSLSLVVDPTMGATLVDAGGPGSEAAIVDALTEAGVGIGDLRHIVLTKPPPADAGSGLIPLHVG